MAHSKLSQFLSLKKDSWLSAPIIKLVVTDSTNNYAMRLLDADTTLPGTTIVAGRQTAGKGQRGNSWEAAAGESLLMSIITQPAYSLDAQFLFSAAIAVALAEKVQESLPEISVSIKWPNDLILGDKKAGGILIENVLRGNVWLWGIVGVGLNVNQKNFGEELPHAASVYSATGRETSMAAWMEDLRGALISAVAAARPPEEIMHRYNAMLYRNGEMQPFIKDGVVQQYLIRGVAPDGALRVTTAYGESKKLRHGGQEWLWP